LAIGGGRGGGKNTKTLSPQIMEYRLLKFYPQGTTDGIEQESEGTDQHPDSKLVTKSSIFGSHRKVSFNKHTHEEEEARLEVKRLFKIYLQFPILQVFVKYFHFVLIFKRENFAYTYCGSFKNSMFIIEIKSSKFCGFV
jgi:hypothetical protein